MKCHKVTNIQTYLRTLLFLDDPDMRIITGNVLNENIKFLYSR